MPVISSDYGTHFAFPRSAVKHVSVGWLLMARIKHVNSDIAF